MSPRKCWNLLEVYSAGDCESPSIYRQRSWSVFSAVARPRKIRPAATFKVLQDVKSRSSSFRKSHNPYLPGSWIEVRLSPRAGCRTFYLLSLGPLSTSRFLKSISNNLFCLCRIFLREVWSYISLIFQSDTLSDTRSSRTVQSNVFSANLRSRSLNWFYIWFTRLLEIYGFKELYRRPQFWLFTIVPRRLLKRIVSLFYTCLFCWTTKKERQYLLYINPWQQRLILARTDLP